MERSSRAAQSLIVWGTGNPNDHKDASWRTPAPVLSDTELAAQSLVPSRVAECWFTGVPL